MAKILGKTTNDSYLVEIKEDELANLIGYYSESSFRGSYCGEPARKEFKTGEEINIAKMFFHLRELASASDCIRKTASQLRLAADLIDKLPNPITAAKAAPDPVTEKSP